MTIRAAYIKERDEWIASLHDFKWVAHSYWVCCVREHCMTLRKNGNHFVLCSEMTHIFGLTMTPTTCNCPPLMPVRCYEYCDSQCCTIWDIPYTDLTRHIIQHADLDYYHQRIQCCHKQCGHPRTEDSFFCIHHNTCPHCSLSIKWLYSVVAVLLRVFRRDIVRYCIMPLVKGRYVSRRGKAHMLSFLDCDSHGWLIGNCPRKLCPSLRITCKARVSSRCWVRLLKFAGSDNCPECVKLLH
jgi:hypothetical protein